MSLLNEALNVFVLICGFHSLNYFSEKATSAEFVKNTSMPDNFNVYILSQHFATSRIFLNYIY
jgi:hypothetical protein